MNELQLLIHYAKDHYWQKVYDYVKNHQPFDEQLLLGSSDETVNEFISACTHEEMDIGNVFNLNFNFKEEHRLFLPLGATEQTIEKFFNSTYPKFNQENYTTILFNNHISAQKRLDFFENLININPTIQDITKLDLFEIWFGENMLYYCDNALILERMVNLGVNCHIINEANENLLHHTTNPDMIDYLVSVGVNVNLKNSSGVLPILAHYENIKNWNNAEDYWPTIETTQAFIRNGSMFDADNFEDIFDEDDVEKLKEYATLTQERNYLNQSLIDNKDVTKKSKNKI
jgi:hypothetical protein